MVYDYGFYGGVINIAWSTKLKRQVCGRLGGKTVS